MKYVWITIGFFKNYWPEVKKCTALTVELWTELMKLAPALASKMREAIDEAEQ